MCAGLVLYTMCVCDHVCMLMQSCDYHVSSLSVRAGVIQYKGSHSENSPVVEISAI